MKRKKLIRKSNNNEQRLIKLNEIRLLVRLLPYFQRLFIFFNGFFLINFIDSFLFSYARNHTNPQPESITNPTLPLTND